MDEAAIKALIDQAIASGLKSGLDSFKSYFGEQLTPIKEQLGQFEVALTEPEPKPQEIPEATKSPETAALMERLAKMEKLEQERQAELRQMKFDGALSKTLGKHNPMHQEMVKELLANRYNSKAVEKDGEWYLPNGSKLSEEVDSFFTSDVGQHFVANPSGQNVGVPSSRSVPTPGKSTKDLTSDDMFADFTL